MTMAYGKQMDALRTELREYFWDGEFRDTVGARVMNGEKAHHPYAVFLSAKTGSPGLVICNYSEKEPITVQAWADSGAAFARYRLVDDARWREAADSITIPPQSAAVVI